jgi:O-antigen/teichoic acid export membrane protein
MNQGVSRAPISLQRIFFTVTAANFIAAGFGFLTTLIPARLLDVSTFGRFSFILSLVTILSCLADFGFSPTVVVYYNRHREKLGITALGKVNRLFFQFLLCVSVLSIPLIVLIGLFYHLDSREVLVVVCAVLLYVVIRYCSSIHQATGDWNRYNAITIITSVTRMLIMAGSAWAALVVTSIVGYGLLLAGFLIQSIVNGIGTWMFSRPFHVSDTTVSLEERRDIFKTLLPLGMSTVVIVVCMRFDSMIIQKVLGAHELGIYSAANTLAFAFPVLTGSLMNVLLRESSKLSDTFLPRLIATQKRYLPLLLLAFAVAMICSGPLLTLLFGTRYSEAIPIFRVLLIPYMGGIFFTPLESYFYAKEPRTILWLKTGQMAVIVGGSLLLIDEFRLYGVATAIALSRILGWIWISTKSYRVIALNRGETV